MVSSTSFRPGQGGDRESTNLNGQAMTLMVGGDERSLEAEEAIVKGEREGEGGRGGGGKGDVDRDQTKLEPSSPPARLRFQIKRQRQGPSPRITHRLGTDRYLWNRQRLCSGRIIVSNVDSQRKEENSAREVIRRRARPERQRRPRAVILRQDCCSPNSTLAIVLMITHR